MTMGFFGFLFWMAVLWFAFRWWQRREVRAMARNYGFYNGWYDSGEFDGRRARKIGRKSREHVEEQQAYIDSLESRVTELEERLDFTERLLAERREPESTYQPAQPAQ
jgi:hypothetical protein